MNVLNSAAGIVIVIFKVKKVCGGACDIGAKCRMPYYKRYLPDFPYRQTLMIKEDKMVRRLVMVAIALALTMAMVPLAGAGPASTAAVRDFFTNALDADGCFRLVHCAQAHQVIKGDKVKENYHCRFVNDEFWGIPALPRRAMKWDYERSDGLIDCTIDGLEGPYRWFSDIEQLLTDDGCFMYTNAQGEDIGKSSWRMVITPSGNVNVTVVYDPPVFELGDGTPCDPDQYQ